MMKAPRTRTLSEVLRLKDDAQLLVPPEQSSFTIAHISTKLLEIDSIVFIPSLKLRRSIQY